MKKEYITPIRQIHEYLGLKANIDEWIKSMITLCKLKESVHFVEKNKEIICTNNAVDKILIKNYDFIMRPEKIEPIKLTDKFDKHFEFGIGDEPFTCTEIMKQIEWDKDKITLAKQLTHFLGTPKHTRIKGKQGKYYFLKLKEGIRDKRKYF